MDQGIALCIKTEGAEPRSLGHRLAGWQTAQQPPNPSLLASYKSVIGTIYLELSATHPTEELATI